MDTPEKIDDILKQYVGDVEGLEAYVMSIIMGQTHTGPGKLINVWSKFFFPTIKSRLIPTHIISKHKDNVWPDLMILFCRNLKK